MTLTRIEKLLLNLIKIPSPSGKEKAVGNFIIKQLQGFKIKKQYIGRDRFNIPFEYKLGFPRLIGNGFAETAFFKNSVKFGGGNIKYAHSDNEHIARKDVNKIPQELIKLLEHKD